MNNRTRVRMRFAYSMTTFLLIGALGLYLLVSGSSGMADRIVGGFTVMFAAVMLFILPPRPD